MEKFDTFRDHFLSLYQSAVADVARRIDEKAASGTRAGLQQSAMSALPEIAADIAAQEYATQRGLPKPPGLPIARDLTKAEWARVCAEQAMRYLKARLNNDVAELARLNDEATAGVCDVAWRTTFDEYLEFFGPSGKRNKIPYIRPASVGSGVITIQPNARVAIVGDWGTGAQPAIQLLGQINTEEPDIVVHLGDIYYSGTPLECQKNFAEPVERILRANGRNPNVFTLSGNHDMYCGGVGYYDLIGKLNAAPFTQPASFFCLRTTDERWQLLGMDTGLHDYSPMHVGDTVTFLEPDELEWHRERIKEFSGNTVLLSHHQLFSAYSAIGPTVAGKRSPLNPKLYDAFKTLASPEKVAAWFWGHEHTLSIYEPFAGLARGRCVGHGAVPTSIIDKIYEPLPDLSEIPAVKQKTELDKVGGVYAHGFAVLALDGELCKASYYQDANGQKKLIFEEQIL
jgi:hypothetical protein